MKPRCLLDPALQTYSHSLPQCPCHTPTPCRNAMPSCHGFSLLWTKVPAPTILLCSFVLVRPRHVAAIHPTNAAAGTGCPRPALSRQHRSAWPQSFSTTRLCEPRHVVLIHAAVDGNLRNGSLWSVVHATTLRWGRPQWPGMVFAMVPKRSPGQQQRPASPAVLIEDQCTGQPNSPTAPPPHSPSTPQPRRPTAPQPRSPTAPQPYSSTALKPHSSTAAPPHSPTALQPHSPTGLQPGTKQHHARRIMTCIFWSARFDPQQ